MCILVATVEAAIDASIRVSHALHTFCRLQRIVTLTLIVLVIIVLKSVTRPPYIRIKCLFLTGDDLVIN
jgi:hypothetical protein